MLSSHTQNFRLADYLSRNSSPMCPKDINHMRLQQQSIKHTKATSDSPFINADEKGEKKNNNTGKCKTFSITSKRKKKKRK